MSDAERKSSGCSGTNDLAAVAAGRGGWPHIVESLLERYVIARRMVAAGKAA